MVGLGILLRPVVNFVVDYLEFDFFCLPLLLNFKPYFVMVSDVKCEKAQKSSVSESDQIVSVLISNYPLSNGGYLISFGKDEPDGSFENFDPVLSSAFKDSWLATFLKISPIFLPAGCFYLPDSGLGTFIESLAFASSHFQMKLLPASSHLQGLILVQVNERSLFKYEQKEENKR